MAVLLWSIVGVARTLTGSQGQSSHNYNHYVTCEVSCQPPQCDCILPSTDVRVSLFTGSWSKLFSDVQ